MERRKTISNPIEAKAAATRQIVEKIEETDGFKKIVGSILSKAKQIGPINEDFETALANAVKGGASQAGQIISLLPAFLNVENRPELVAKLKEDLKGEKQDTSWIDVLAKWNVERDPDGSSVLDDCKRIRVKEAEAAAANISDENQKALILLRAEALAAGHDLVISHFQESGEMAKAA